MKLLCHLPDTNQFTCLRMFCRFEESRRRVCSDLVFGHCEAKLTFMMTLQGRLIEDAESRIKNESSPTCEGKMDKDVEMSLMSPLLLDKVRYFFFFILFQ